MKSTDIKSVLVLDRATYHTVIDDADRKLVSSQYDFGRCEAKDSEKQDVERFEHSKHYKRIFKSYHAHIPVFSITSIVYGTLMKLKSC